MPESWVTGGVRNVLMRSGAVSRSHQPTTAPRCPDARCRGCGCAGPRSTAGYEGEGHLAMADLAYLALLVGVFALLALMLRGLEKLQ